MAERPTRILLIEDDRVDRLACRRALSRAPGASHEFLEAETGRAGLELARSAAPDCILLDYHLPDLNGLEVLAELAHMPHTPPVIMLTGAEDVAVAVQAMRRGAREYLVKDTERRYLELLPTVVEHARQEQRMRDEKLQTEASLHAERDFTAAVLGTVAALIVVLDRDGRIVRFNKACEETSGYSYREVRGKSLWDLSILVPEEAEAARAAFADLRAGHFPSEFENYWQHRDGTRRRIAWSNTALVGADSAVEHVIGTGLDVTERRAAEEAARQHHADIEKLYREHAVGAMASAFAHELNQPLTAIATYSDASLRQLRAGRADDQLMHNLEQTALQAQRAAQIIRHIRAFLRRGQLDAAADDLNAAVESAIHQIAAAAQAEGIRIEVRTADDIPPVLLRRAAFEKVLLNLLQNALEASRDAGLRATITVRTQINGGGFAEVTVSDTGPGLDPETAERIFQPFYTTKPDGLGMGLAISRTLIEAHGGRLWVDPPARGGAVFHLTLPLAS